MPPDGIPRVPSELKRGALRISANYARLVVNVVLGMAVAPLLIYGVGVRAFGLFALLGSVAGLAQMFRDVSRASMNRELGAAWHDPDPEHFPRAYNAAVVLGAILAGACALVFLGLLLALPLLNIPPELASAARWTVIALGVNTVAVVLLTPQFNMYLVTERYVAYNLPRALERGANVVIAVVLFPVLGIHDPGTGLTLYAVLTNAASLVLILAWVARIVRIEPRLAPRLSRVTRAALRSVAGTGAWNIATSLAMNLHIRVGQIIVNVFFGTEGNAAFGLAVQLTAYVRMLTVGITEGLDAVAARLSMAPDAARAVASLLRHSTRLTGWVALPAACAIAALGAPILDLWIGRRAAGPNTSPAQIAALLAAALPVVQILNVGLTARALTDNWTRILYGSGFVARYAPQVLLGGVLNPIVAVALIHALPGERQLWGPALSFSVIFTIVHFLWLPFTVGACLRVRVREVYLPLARPALAAALCLPLLLVPAMLTAHWSAWWLLVVAAAYGSAHALLSWRLVLSADERSRLVRGVRRAREPRAPAGRDRPSPGDPATAEAGAEPAAD